MGAQHIYRYAALGQQCSRTECFHLTGSRPKVGATSRKSQQGFTIVEVLVVIALFAILIPALSLGITNLTAINNRARDLSLANMIAQNKIEQLRSTGYNSIPTGTTSFSSELPATLAQPNSASYTVDNSVNGIKQITIDISYRDYQQTKAVTYRSIISEIGVGQ